MQLKDIKSRAILVDFVPGSHGHFFVSVMNSLIQENYTIPTTKSQKNFHELNFIPPTIWKDTDVLNPLDQFEFTLDIIENYKEDRPIFWGMHWSNRCVFKNLPTIQSYINGYNLVELYFSSQSHEQYFINSIYNVGDAARENILDPEKFNSVFYETASAIDADIVATISTNQPWKDLSTSDVINLLEAWLFKRNQNRLTLARRSFNPREVRYLHNCDLLNPCVSFDVSYFYNYNMFVSMVQRVFGYYNLPVLINYEFLKTQWDLLMSKQVTNNIRNTEISDQDLHPAQLAYRNYLRKFNVL